MPKCVCLELHSRQAKFHSFTWVYTSVVAVLASAVKEEKNMQEMTD